MTERPSTAVLARILALCFVGAFAAAVMLKSHAAPAPAARTAAVTAPGTTSEKVAVVARLRRPAMSREAALPGLRLPPVRHHRARRASQPVPAVVVAAAPVVATPVPTPVATWTPTPAPTPVLTPVPTPRPVAPVHTAPTTPNVGMTFDSSG